MTWLTMLLLLLCGMGTHATAKALYPEKTASGGFGAIQWENAWGIGSQAIEPQWDETALQPWIVPDVCYGPNVYTYVRQNPWTMFDPHGLWGFNSSNGHVIDSIWNGFARLPGNFKAGTSQIPARMNAGFAESAARIDSQVASGEMNPAIGAFAKFKMGQAKVTTNASIVVNDIYSPNAALLAGSAEVQEQIAQAGPSGMIKTAVVVAATEVVSKKAEALVKTAKNVAEEATESIKKVTVSKRKYPESYAHAQSTGNPSGPFTKDAANAKNRRRENLKGKDKVEGKDLDKWPPAQTTEGTGASVTPISPSDNRGSGATIGGQTRGLKNGDKFEVDWTND